MGALGSAPVWAVVPASSAFAFSNAVAGNLTAVHPAEILPTDVRTSGVGLASAASRVGAAVGTGLPPVGLDAIGAGPCLLLGAAVRLLGALVSQVLAPETTGLSLTTTSSSALPDLAHRRSDG